jgi:hypothetical protein
MFHLQNIKIKSVRVGLVLMIAALLLIVPVILAGWQLLPAQAAPPQVGVGLANQNALEFIGRINQDGPDFVGYGYLTYVRGLSNAQLFTGTPSETTARFTFVATATMTSRAILTEVFVINSLGNMTFYFDNSPSPRNFNDPDSFASGTPIATASMRYQDILLVQAPDKGLAQGVAEVTQLTATPFTLGGTSYTLGQPNLLYRFSSLGNGTRTDPNPNFPRSFVLMAGHAETTGLANYLPVIQRDGN